MKTRTLHKALSMLLTAAMVLNMGLTPVFAAEGATTPGISGVCTHHTGHTADCGYQQGTLCTHEHTEDCYTKELTCTLTEGDTAGDAPEVATDSDAVVDSGNAPAGEAHTHGEDCYTKTDNCKHEHDEACGYTPDSPCRFDAASCTQCKPANQPIEKVCICPPVDSGELVHGKDCPLYTAPALSEAVQALIALVDALPNAADITEDNKEATLPAFETAVEAYGALSIDDKAAFEETAQYIKLMALRDVLLGLNTLEIKTHPVTSEAELTAAIASANTGDTIQLAESFNFASNITFPAGKVLTLDLNGKTLTGDSQKTITIAATAELTITDSDSGGTLMSKGASATGFIVNSGTLNISAGTISVPRANADIAIQFIVVKNKTGIFNFTGGTFQITGNGTIVENNGGAVAIENLTYVKTERVTALIGNPSNGTVDIKNSTIRVGDPSNTKPSNVLANSSGTATITNCTISASGGGSQAISNNGTATIENSNITCDGISTIDNGDTLEITGGKVSYTAIVDDGVSGTIKNNGTLTINSGVFTSNFCVIHNSSSGKTTIKDGLFASTAQTAPTLRGNDNFTVVNGIIIGGADGSGNTAALLNKVHGATTLTENVSIPSGKTLTVPAGASLTIAPDVTLSNGGTLDNLGTVTNNGMVRNRGTVKTTGSDGKGTWIGDEPVEAGSNITVGSGLDADYASIVDAWNEAGATATFTLTSDVSFNESLRLVNVDYNRTLDLNGHTLEYTSTEDGIAPNSGNTLTIKNGVYIAKALGGRAFSYAHGVVTLENCLILGDGAGDAAADAWKVHGTATLYNSYTIKAGKTLTVPAGATLTIPAGVTLTNNGTIDNKGTIVNNGTIISSGTLTGTGRVSGNGEVQTVLAANMITLDKDSYVYTGSAFEPTVTVASTPWTGAAPFEQDTDYTVGYSANTAAGTATVTVTPIGSNLTGSAVNKTFKITTANSALGLTTDKSSNIVEYGETITFTANVSIPTTRGRSAAVNTVDFYYGSTKLNDSTIALTESGGIGSATFAYDTTTKKIPAGEDIEITAEYGGSGNLNGQTGTISVTLNKKALRAAVNYVDASAKKVYDGNANFTNVALSISDGVVSGDSVAATADGRANNANVSSNSFTPTSISLTGAHADYYYLPLTGGRVTGSVAITAATPTVSVTAAAKPKSFLRTIIGDHNDTIVLTATTEGENGEMPNGEVVFKHDTTTLTTVSTTNGVATYDWANPPAGNITVTAEFTASDSNYISTAVTGTADAFDIDKVEQSALTLTVPALTYGDAGKSLTTSGGSTNGTVTYNVTGDCVTVGTGGAITVVKAGTAKVTATMAGNENFNAVTSEEETITVNPATPTIAWGSNTAQTVTYTGSPIDETAITPPTVTLVREEQYEGEITYTYTAKAKLSNLFGLFAEKASTLPTDVGVYEVTAHTAKFTNYTAASSSDKMTLTIEKSNPTLTIDSGYTGKDYDGKEIAPPTATQMTITGAAYDDVNFTYSADSNMAGATATPPTNAGTYYVWASVADGANTNAVASVAASFTIAKITPVLEVTTDKPSGDLGGKEITVTVKITNPEGATSGFPKADEITIVPTNATLKTALVQQGTTGVYTATYILDAYSAGAKAKFVATVPNATTNYNANTTGEAAEVEILDKYTPTVEIMADKTEITYGESITLTATVGKNGQTSPLAGTVQFKLDNASLGSPVAIDADGVATLTVGRETLIVSRNFRDFKAEFIPESSSDYKARTSTNVSVLVRPAKMDGEVTITGTPKYGETLTANTSALAGLAGDELGGFDYQWLDSEFNVLGNANTYTIQEADIDKEIFVRVYAKSGNYAEKDSAPVTPTKADSHIAITSTPDRTYDGTAVSNPAVSKTGSAGAVTFEWYSGAATGTPLGSAPTNVGFYSVKAILAADSTHEGATDTIRFSITPKRTTPTIEPITAVTYDGTAQEPTITAKGDGKTLVSGTDYDVTYSDNIGAGVGTGKVAIKLKGNYSGSASATFTIDKASGLTATTPNNILMIKEQETEYTFDLSTIALNKTDAGTKTFALGALTNSNNIFKAVPALDTDGKTLKFTSNIIATPAANQATQVVTISTQNYADTTVTLTFDITDKTPVTITGLEAATSLVYNGAAQNGYTGTAQFAPSWTGTLTYTYYEGTGTGGTKLSGAPKNAGTYTVVASIPDSDTSMAGSHAPITFTIGAKEITVAKGSYKVSKAYDGNTNAGTGSGTLGVTGILSSDSGVTVTPGTIPAYSDSAVKADYSISLPISISGDTNSNYALAASTVTVPGEITKASVTATIDPIAAVTYTGSQIKPAVTVKVGGNTIADSNYTVEYGANVNAGTNAGSVTVKAKVTGNYAFGDVTANFTINKAAGSAISGNVAGSYTGNGTNFTYTITPISGAEYKMDSGAWQDSNVFAGIVPQTKHTFSARMKEDANHLAGAAKAGSEVEFVKLSGVAAPALAYTVSREGSNKTITITAVDKAEYQFGSDAWSDTNAKTYSTDETVIIGIRMKTTDTHEAGTPATASVNLAKQEQDAPAAFTLTYAANGETNYTVTIPEVAGCEYSFDGATYSSTRTKTANVGDTVTGYMRKAETDTHNASPAVSASVTLPMFKVQPVTASPSDRNFSGSTSVSLASDTAGAEIYYTTDNSTPSTASTKYTTAFPLTATTTVKAIAVKTGMTDSDVASFTFTKNSGGGGGTGGGGGESGGGGSIVTPPVTPENPNPPTTAETGVNSKTDKDGNATTAVAEKDITNAIDKAQKEAKKNGTEANGIAITLNVKTDKNATALGVTLPQKSVSELIAANVTQVTVKNGLSTVTLDLATLKALAGGDVILTVSKADTAKLSKEAQTAIAGRPVFQFGLTSGGKTVSNFEGGRAGLQIPYTLTTTEQVGNLCGVYVDASGKVNWLEASSYDPITGMMLISAQHFSTYGIGYKQSTPKFTDVGTHWAKNDIDFVVARGLLTGTSNTTFAPDTSMTRGMFVTALGRLAGVDTKKYSTTKFTDVAATAYYSPYVAWASANNIVNGTSDTTFSLDKAITRQEMAVMLVNYSKAIGYKLPSVHAEVTFTDAGSIASWAKDAVKQMQMAGILMGKSGNRFDHTATATRAEVSAMLRRYVELVVNTETAEGWAMNESGQWLYIENGKRVTGNKTIDGKSYTFDQYGVTTALPPERKYLTYTVQAGDSFWSIARKYKVSMFELAKVNGKTIFSVIYAGDTLKVPQQ